MFMAAIVNTSRRQEQAKRLIEFLASDGDRGGDQDIRHGAGR